MDLAEYYNGLGNRSCRGEIEDLAYCCCQLPHCAAGSRAPFSLFLPEDEACVHAVEEC
jgi:hypothetical protein